MRQNSSLSNHSSLIGLIPRRLLICVAAIALQGCASLSYYSQAISGHLDLMSRREPIEALIADPNTAEPLRDRLQTVRAIRRFASEQLALPDNRSYSHYADLERDAAVWLVTAAPELSLVPKTWCYWVVGCLNYRGYFDRDRAESEARRLADQRMDTRVSNGLAYSTLGFTADPVLNTMLVYDDDELAGILFHELAHQVLYLKGDAQFSESFASAVALIGKRRWVEFTGRRWDDAAQRRRQEREAAFNALMLSARADLEALFEGDSSEPDKHRGKQAIYARLKEHYQMLRKQWDGYPGYDHWFESGPNNADLALLATYELSVPAFLALYRASGEEMAAFFAAARSLSREPEHRRKARLEELAASP